MATWLQARCLLSGASGASLWVLKLKRASAAPLEASSVMGLWRLYLAWLDFSQRMTSVCRANLANVVHCMP